MFLCKLILFTFEARKKIVMRKKAFIVSLITDDLINQKLVNCFREMGIDAENYQLDLGNSVFYLMGIKRTTEDTYFNQYMKLAEATKSISFEANREPFKKLALEIYNYLNTLKKTTIHLKN